MSEMRKLVILGGGGVGKSALTIQFIQGYFLDVYDPTIEDSYRKQTSVDGKVVLIDLLDTAGQEEYQTMRSIYMRSGDGFLVVYSITSRKSFEEAKALYQQILRNRDADVVPTVLVGNKSDLPEQREVPASEALEFAQRCGISFMEASAMARLNVDEAFHQAIRDVRTADPNLAEQTKPGSKKQHKKQQCTIF